MRVFAKFDEYRRARFWHLIQQGQKEAEYLIETLTHPGDLVLDSFVGTGTVLVAAKRKGRRFIGTEISKGRYDMALSLISKEEPLNDFLG